MNPKYDHGEPLARAMSELVEAHEIWDVAQFTRPARPEWEIYLAKLRKITQISLDISRTR